MRNRCAWPAILALIAGGCAAMRGDGPGAASRPALVVSDPSTDPALIPLADIEPRPALRDPPATTRPASRPSLDAIQIYARGRDALLQGKRAEAAELFRRALSLDPDGFELWYSLGLACAGGSSGNERALHAFERALSLRQDHLDLQLQLGRQYLAGQASRPDRAIEHLRLAQQTVDYKFDVARAAMVDLMLARALQQLGFEAAALEQYRKVVDRLSRPRHILRGHPELVYLYTRQDVLHVQVGDLHQRLAERRDNHAAQQTALAAKLSELGQSQQADDARRRAAELREQALRDREAAVGAFKLAAAHMPQSLENARRVTQSLISLGRADEARRIALDWVVKSRGGRDAIELLRGTLAAAGRAGMLVDELLSLPDGAWDGPLARRAVELLLADSLTPRAAQLLIDLSARRPDLVAELSPLWSRLCAFGVPQRITPAAVRQMDVPPSAWGARFYWEAQLADQAGRRTAARAALEQSVRQKPAFTPAFRELLAMHLARRDWTDARKSEEAGALIELARGGGDEGLATELSGLLLLSQRKNREARETLTSALRLSRPAPELQMARAAAMHRAGDTQAFEQALWKLLGEFPGFEEGYQALYGHYVERASAALAVKVLNTWLAADPSSVSARLLKAGLFLQIDQPEEAARLIEGCFADDPFRPDVSGAMLRLYTRTGRMDDLLKIMEAARVRHPHNRAVVSLLVDAQRRLDPAAAARAVEQMREAVAGDADLLYQVAHLYDRLERRDESLATLQQALKVDPRHPGAANDLGYLWADQGRNLDEAEALIRIAVEAEPENAAYLDSLGWVLYKRGRFEEARRRLEESLAHLARPDPVVLDHLGDVLYRLGEGAAAWQHWRRAEDRIAPDDLDRPDLRRVREALTAKLEQFRMKQPVRVAPLGEGVAPGQAGR